MGNREVKGEKFVNCLLVEGNDDRHVIWSLLKYYSIPKLFDVKEKGGIDAIVNDLDVELDNPGLTRLGVVVDVDASLQDSWDVLRHKLVKYGYKTVPMSPNAEGTIIVEADLPTVGIWLMPENMLPGMLEDFLHFLVPVEDSLWLLAEEVMLQVEGQGCRFRPTYRSKAKMHTWLAWQEEPGKPLGQAITACYLDADAPHAQKLVAWLRDLFT